MLSDFISITKFYEFRTRVAGPKPESEPPFLFWWKL